MENKQELVILVQTEGKLLHLQDGFVDEVLYGGLTTNRREMKSEIWTVLLEEPELVLKDCSENPEIFLK